MEHFGDITKLSGYSLPPVDCLCGGSPCQDLSVAGLRKGLSGERSGLFMEQVRITKELRENDRRNGRPDNDIRPRYLVWENVPGAFSSNGGKDFQAVLSEIVRIAEPDAPDVPLPEGGGRWSKSGCLMGIGTAGPFSVCWRLHDAQFWGVAQRRKRIALVADFGGLSAPEILFERKGLSGDFNEGEETGKRTAGGAEERVGTTGKCLNGWDVQSKHIQPTDGIAEALWAGECRRHGYEPFGDVCETVQAAYGTGGGNAPIVLNQPITMNPRPMSMVCGIDNAATLGADDYKQPRIVLDTNPQKTVCMDAGWQETSVEQSGALLARQYKDPPVVCSENIGNLVRRLTPLECERLQGFPDGWTDIGDWVDSKNKTHTASDSARYKALGNSIAVGYANNASGFWMWLMKRISAQYERIATLGSLFDGIGGFPLAWETFNGKGSALWASEIEEFPIAVTKKRFPEMGGEHGIP